ncbi:hypothetical protein PR202_ga16399 [Eleusine coracana subsp. coracana]|uniref:Generative cell specific-1/HAP2 domain-containing protein n=1 Tax=Eleusine coracana subsp. coracana TaxID=191504 RepID=A0AAV5CMP8_ELECO|nr:hypothetical protein PR202_ga16399 [Eleusine coracana subsp. coracana]
MSPPRLAAVFLVLLALLAASGGVDILSKSSIESCARDSDPGAPLSCDRKLVLNMAVPSGSSGREASIVAKITEAEENDTNAMQNIRDPPVITFNKTAVYAAYALTYLRDVAYRPEELVVETRKCEPDAGADVVQSCERFHVFKIGTRSLGFKITVQEVVVSPENRTVVSPDNFLRVNLVGDLGGYTNIPSFDGLYLVTPRKHAGVYSFSVGVEEVRKTNLLVEINADDIEYVYQSRTKCSSFLDLSCHFQYICVGRMLMLFSLFLATVLVTALLWFLHHKGFFDHLYDWWADLFGLEPDDGAGHRRHRRGHHQYPHHRHGEHPRRHHAHKGGPSHHHHHVLHRHGEQQPDAAAGGHRHRHELELGVRHGDGHKHWHGKAVVALNLDGPSQQAPSWLHETGDREHRRHRRHARHHHKRAE